MIKNLFAAWLLAVTLALPAEAKLNVIATTADLGALAHAVGGDNIKVTVLGRPTEDPHFVDAKPSFLVQLSRADLLVEGGAELEIGWLPPLMDQARNPRIQMSGAGHFSAAEGIELLEVPEKLDRSKGDLHAMGNPHYLIDPANAKIVAQRLAEKFCEMDRANCEKYRGNYGQFAARLDAKLAEWEKALAPFKGQHVTAYHNSWPYFGHRFGLKVDLFLEPKPGIPPTPAHLADVIEVMKKDNVKVIFMEPFLNRRTAEKVAEDTGATIVDVSHFPGGLKGTQDDYIGLLDRIVTATAAALQTK